MAALPAISGYELLKLLKKDGWRETDRGTHGAQLMKSASRRTRVTVVPLRRKSLARTTLHKILGPAQTGLGRNGLLALIELHGLK